MKNLLLIIVAILGVACGDGTLGPLTSSGLRDRELLRLDVNWLRQHGSSDKTPLDVLIDIETYEQQDNPKHLYFNIKAQMVDERGRIDIPRITMNGTRMAPIGIGRVQVLKPVTDTALVFTFEWPDTTITVPINILSATSMGADTGTYRTAWSRTQRPRVPLPGRASDSIVVSAINVSIVDIMDFGMYSTIADLGSYELPGRIADNARVGEQIYVRLDRSYYRVIPIETPTSGYGDRVIGVLQLHTIHHLLEVTE